MLNISDQKLIKNYIISMNKSLVGGLMAGWIDGWKDGGKNGFKDCLQQSISGWNLNYIVCSMDLLKCLSNPNKSVQISDITQNFLKFEPKSSDFRHIRCLKTKHKKVKISDFSVNEQALNFHFQDHNSRLMK